MKQFIKLINQFGYKYDRWQVWSDFLEMYALALANAWYRNDDMEQQYLNIIKRYDKKEQQIFPQLAGEVVNGLERGYCDFLGQCFHELELHNKHVGQFFTPYHLSKAIAQLQMSDLADREGIITVSEPSCGSGGRF